MERYIKLYTKILDNPKTGRLKDKSWRIMIEIFLVAGETFDNGKLPDVSMLAWRLRRSEKEVRDALNDLVKIGTVTLENDNPTVTNFEEYQNTNQTAYERVKNYRKRQRDNANDNADDMQMITVDKDRDKDIDKDNKELREVKESVLKNAREEKPAPKHKHGSYKHVLLTDAEVGKLAKRFPDWEKKIQNLDDYLQNNKKKHYDDHYLTICKWADDDAEKARKAPQAQAQPESWIELADRIMAADGILGGAE